MQRIVITGLGVISPIGNSVEAFRANLFAGKGGIGTQSFPFRGQEVRFPAAAVKDFNVEDYIDAKKAPMLDRFAQFAVAAATQASGNCLLALAPSRFISSAWLTMLPRPSTSLRWASSCRWRRASR